MKPTAKPAANGGFTLIEVMIAVFILVTALLGIISTTLIVVKSNTLSKTMTTATTLARDRMEQLKNTGYDNLAGGTDNTTMNNSIYTATWTVTADGTPAAGMKTIVVTVGWNWRGVQRSVAVTTIVAR